MRKYLAAPIFEAVGKSAPYRGAIFCVAGSHSRLTGSNSGRTTWTSGHSLVKDFSALRLQACFQYNNARGGRPSPPFRGAGGPPRFGSGGVVEYNEPALVAKLLELFPIAKGWIPISKWSHDLPETLQEPISRFGGLGKFATSQSNFFIVRKENNINVVALTPMAAELCREKAKVIKEREKQRAKLAQRRGGRGGFGRGRGNFGSRGGRR